MCYLVYSLTSKLYEDIRPWVQYITVVFSFLNFDIIINISNLDDLQWISTY